MGKGQGLWTAVYGEAFDHDKTLKAVAVLTEWWGDKPEWPLPDVVICSLVRAHLFLLERQSVDGIFRIPKGQSHRFTAMACPAYEGQDMPLLTAFLEAGFVELVEDGAHKTVYRLHEYEVHNWRILRKRPKYQAFAKKRESRAEGPAPDPRVETEDRRQKT